MRDFSENPLSKYPPGVVGVRALSKRLGITAEQINNLVRAKKLPFKLREGVRTYNIEKCVAAYEEWKIEYKGLESRVKDEVVAKELGIGRSQVSKLSRMGKLPFKMRNGIRAYDIAECKVAHQKYLDELRLNPAVRISKAKTQADTRPLVYIKPANGRTKDECFSCLNWQRVSSMRVIKIPGCSLPRGGLVTLDRDTVCEICYEKHCIKTNVPYVSIVECRLAPLPEYAD